MSIRQRQHSYLHGRSIIQNNLSTLQEKLRQRRQLDNQIENMLIEDTMRRKHLDIQKNRLGIYGNGIKNCLNKQNNSMIAKEKENNKIDSPTRITNQRKRLERQKTVQNIRNKYMKKQSVTKRNKIQISQFRINQEPLVQRNTNLYQNYEMLRRKQQQAKYYHQMARSMNRLQRYLRQKQLEEKQYFQLQAKQKQLMYEAFKKRINELTQKYTKQTVKTNEVLNKVQDRQIKVDKADEIQNETKILKDITTTRSPRSTKRYNYLSPFKNLQHASPLNNAQKDQTPENKILKDHEKQERIRCMQNDDKKLHQEIMQEQQKMLANQKNIEEKILQQIKKQRQLQQLLHKQIQFQNQIKQLKQQQQQRFLHQKKFQERLKQRQQERGRFVKQQLQKLKERQRQREQQNRIRRERQQQIQLEISKQNMKLRLAQQEQRRIQQQKWQIMLRKQQQQIQKQFQQQQKILLQLKQKQSKQRQLRDKQIRQMLQRQRQQIQQLLKEKQANRHMKNNKEKQQYYSGQSGQQQQFQRKEYNSCPKMFTSPFNMLNKNMSPTQNQGNKFISLKDSRFGQYNKREQKKSRKRLNKSQKKHKSISAIDSMMPQQADYVRNIANSRIQKRIRCSNGIFKDSQYRGKKHQIQHLNHTFDLERRARSQIKQRINSNPKVLKKHALVVN